MAEIIIIAAVTAGVGTAVAVGVGIVGAGAALGYFGTQFALTAGLALLSQLLAPKPSVGTSADVRRVVRQAVTPARWILGTARVGGVLVYYNERTNRQGGDAHMAVVIAEGRCDSIQQIYVNGINVPFTRERRATTLGTLGDKLTPNNVQVDPDNPKTNFSGKFEVYEYFKADGTQGEELRNQASVTDWTTEHKLNGKSWVYIKLIQPYYSRSKAHSQRFWTAPPTIEFVVNGLRFTHPLSRTGAGGVRIPAFTNNAAACRYWLLRHRRGIPESAIDLPSYRAAWNVCNAGLNFTTNFPDEGYDNATKIVSRYSVNGVVQSGDPIQTIEDHMNYAMQGAVAEIGGIHYFLPGADRPSVAHITPDMMLGGESISPSPSLQERVNAATMSIAQYRDGDWERFTIPEITDDDALARDGQRLPRDFGENPFVVDALTALRLTTIALRRARQSLSAQYNIRPGDDFENYRIRQGSIVTLTDPAYGIENKRFLVTNTTINPDFTLSLGLSEHPTGMYADTFVLPPLLPRKINVVPADILPKLSGLAATQQRRVNPDGTSTVDLLLTWTGILVPRARIQYSHAAPSAGGAEGAVGGQQDAEPDTDTSIIVDDTQHLIEGVAIGDVYSIQVRHEDRDGSAGEFSDMLSVTVQADTEAPGAVTGLTAVAVPGGYRLSWVNPSDNDWAFTEIFQSDVVTASVSGDHAASVAGDTFERTDLTGGQTYYVSARAVDLTGNMGTRSAKVSVVAGTSAAGLTADQESRLQGHYYVTLALADARAWSDARANTATPGSNITGDRVTQSYNHGTISWAETREWNGTAWVTVARSIDGRLIVEGSISSGELATGAVTAGKIAANSIHASQLAADAINATKLRADVIEYIIAQGGLTNMGPGIVGGGSLSQTLHASQYTNRRPGSNVNLGFLTTINSTFARGQRDWFVFATIILTSTAPYPAFNIRAYHDATGQIASVDIPASGSDYVAGTPVRVALLPNRRVRTAALSGQNVGNVTIQFNGGTAQLAEGSSLTIDVYEYHKII